MLVPTAKSKMYNARLDFINLGGQQKQHTTAAAAGDKNRKRNADSMTELIALGKLDKGIVSFTRENDGEQRLFPAFVERLEPKDVLRFLTTYKWHADYEDARYVATHGRVLGRVLDFLQSRRGDPEIDSWLLVAPHLVNPKDRWPSNGHSFHVRERTRVGGSRYNVYSEPPHVDGANFLAGLENGAFAPTRQYPVTASHLESSTARTRGRS